MIAAETVLVVNAGSLGIGTLKVGLWAMIVSEQSIWVRWTIALAQFVEELTKDHAAQFLSVAHSEWFVSITGSASILCLLEDALSRII